ncbi:hypothetical protein [Acinetobacter proteolyticus]|uniref:Uncharacterized protein n=1 Tax=Acinetobacter proteolyticus TaxID=1776741 RepID=A0A2N0WI99_9GAMM|nr:hypothetical protein [Acinetobacter proteolyticus]PKF35529.1 hypothetical protein CW311_04365 [Acinetobacter proteolyticus]
MNKLNYLAIPQHVIEAKAIRFVANTPKEALELAKRKGAIGEPILTLSKASSTTVYFASDELKNMALELQKRAENIRRDQDKTNVLTRVQNLLNAKLKKQGTTLKRPNFN